MDSYESYHSYRWIRGWPLACNIQFGATPGAPLLQQLCKVRLAAPLGSSGDWVVDKNLATWVHGAVLAINLLVGLVITACVFVALRALCEKRQWTIRFSVRFALLVPAIAAISFAVRTDIALVTDAFAFWDDLYEFKRLIALLALNLGFVVSIVWLFFRLVRRYNVSKPNTTNHGLHAEASN